MSQWTRTELIALIGVIIATFALIPGFGQWLSPREPTLANPIVLPTIQIIAGQLVNPVSPSQIKTAVAVALLTQQPSNTIAQISAPSLIDTPASIPTPYPPTNTLTIKSTLMPSPTEVPSITPPLTQVLSTNTPTSTSTWTPLPTETSLPNETPTNTSTWTPLPPTETTTATPTPDLLSIIKLYHLTEQVALQTFNAAFIEELPKISHGETLDELSKRIATLQESKQYQIHNTDHDIEVLDIAFAEEAAHVIMNTIYEIETLDAETNQVMIRSYFQATMVYGLIFHDGLWKIERMRIVEQTNLEE